MGIFSLFGFGYDREGFDRDGYQRNGFNRDGFDRDGFDSDGYDKRGFGRDGYNCKGFDQDGYDRGGFDWTGYNRDDFDRGGYDYEGFDRDGYDSYGYNRDRLDRDGFYYDGYDRDGFDRDGFDHDGNNRDSFNWVGFDSDGDNGDKHNRIAEKIYQILSSNFASFEKADITAAIKDHSIPEQLQIVAQMETIDISRFHQAYKHFEKRKYSSNSALPFTRGIQAIGICTYNNATERYRDTDYFGVTNTYDKPKWQEDLDIFEQCKYCTYFIM